MNACSRCWTERRQPFTLVGELKIDGNALALSYRHGVLERAATRGDGSSGEEITANVRTISSIPLRLQIDDPPEWVEVRGEAFIPDDTFAAINNERAAHGDALFANPRNACAGTLRQRSRWSRPDDWISRTPCICQAITPIAPNASGTSWHGWSKPAFASIPTASSAMA